jgi:thioesterase domain-containing protein
MPDNRGIKSDLSRSSMDKRTRDRTFWSSVITLSRHLVQHRPKRLSKSLIELKHGGSRNLFLVHDGDGDTLLYLNLAHHLPADLAVVGIEPMRVQGVPLAQASVEAMAASYVEEVRRIQPIGPYLLGGLCAGGTIAFEMAFQLVGAGESVEIVVLLDTVRPHTPFRPGRIASYRFNRLKEALTVVRDARHSRIGQIGALAVISRKVANALAWEIMQRSLRWSIGVRFLLLRSLLAWSLPWPTLMPGLSVRQIYESAEARYVPKPLSRVSVVLVRARMAIAGVENDTPFVDVYADENLGWPSLTDELNVIDVDAGHSSMLREPFVQSLASVLGSRFAVPADIRAPMASLMENTRDR